MQGSTARRCSDGTGRITLRFFHFRAYQKQQLSSGTQLRCFGEVKAGWCRHFVSYGGDAYFKDWHADRTKSTGLLLQKGAHDIDVLHWLCGGYSKRVSAMGALSVYGQIEDKDTVLKAVLEREAQMSTGMQLGVAIPHCKTTAVDGIVTALAIKKEGVDFSSLDGELSKIFVMTVSSTLRAGPHIEFLA